MQSYCDNFSHKIYFLIFITRRRRYGWGSVVNLGKTHEQGIGLCPKPASAIDPGTWSLDLLCFCDTDPAKLACYNYQDNQVWQRQHRELNHGLEVTCGDNKCRCRVSPPVPGARTCTPVWKAYYELLGWPTTLKTTWKPVRFSEKIMISDISYF